MQEDQACLHLTVSYSFRPNNLNFGIRIEVLTCRDSGQVVSRWCIEASGDICLEEAAVSHVEAHEAEGHELVQQQHEEQQGQPLLCAGSTLRKAGKDKPCKMLAVRFMPLCEFHTAVSFRSQSSAMFLSLMLFFVFLMYQIP